MRDALLRLGVQPGDRVGIDAPKSVSVVVAIFGILKARAAYVPVDSAAPPRRNAMIFEDCAVKAAVIAQPLLDGLATAMRASAVETPAELDEELSLVGVLGRSASAAESDAVRGSPGTPPSDPSSDDLCYILYTSGSTGQPKGIAHTHASALSFIDWCSQAFEPTEDDRFSSHAPFHFDLSILDVFLPIKHGATLVLIGDDAGKQPLRLGPLISEQRITVWYSTPSILRLLTEFGRLDKLEFPALRLVLFAGEVFTVKHLRALKRIWPRPRFFNLYGPTETNVCTAYEIPQEISDDRVEPFPIGFACSGDRTIVVDDGHAVQTGEEGELLVSGGSVMREYWNLPDRTRAAFLTDASGTAWYRTGDVVSESVSDGYVFRGRRDRMVKRRGYRVELGEIEAALCRHPLVSESAVVSLPDDENGVLISAFVVVPDGSRPSLVEMKRFCAEHLPAYMIPDRFSFPPSLPRTSTQKVDYQDLLNSRDSGRSSLKTQS
jgi:amino acid adenylation domain-containing protein